MRIQEVVEWIRTALTDPVSELSRWQRSMRQAYRVGRYSIRHLGEDRAAEMAAALSFRTLFGLLPVLVVATVVAKAVFGAQLQEMLQRVVTMLGLDEVQLVLPTRDGGAEDGAAGTVDLGTWISELVAYAAGLDLAALGWVGFAVVAFSAIWVLVTIETCFNVICRAPSARSWWQRIPIYWFAVTFGPLAIAVLPVMNRRIAATLDAALHWGPVGGIANGLLDFLLLWGFWVLAYLWVPNTRMQLRPVMIGAAVTAILLMVGRGSLGLYLKNAFALNGLYGSLGLVPLFMFWMYLMWLFVLLGLQVTSLLQALKHHRLEDLEIAVGRIDFVDPAGTVALMQFAAKKFEAGEPLDPEEAGASLNLSSRAIERMIEALCTANLLHRLDDGRRLGLARPPEGIATREVLEIGFALADDASARPASPWVAQIRKRQLEFVGGADLRSLLGDAGTAGASPAPA